MASSIEAPAITRWAQTGSDLVVNWAPRPETVGIGGYRVELAIDPSFTGIVAALTASIQSRSHVFSGFPGGRWYYVRVAVVAGGETGQWGSPASGVLLLLSSGDLDGWSRVGTPPPSVHYYTPAGIRRGILGTSQALWLETYSTGPADLAPGVYGIQRTVPTTPGREYTVRLSLTVGAGALVTTYQVVTPGESSPPMVVPVGGSSVAFPAVTWVATSDTSTIRVMMAGNVTVPSASMPIERAAVTNVRVTEAGGYYYARLRSTVYESDLASHFDLACNSVGATWYADRDNVTQFSLPGNALPVSATFSDEESDGALNYVDIDAGYDTRSMVNELEATNHGIGDDGLADDTTEAVRNAESVSLYGPRFGKIDVNLYSLPPYDGAFRDRLAEILAASGKPDLLINSVTWNAQQNITAAAELELAQRVTAVFRGTVQDSQLIGLEHTITPTRWLIRASLIKL